MTTALLLVLAAVVLIVLMLVMPLVAYHVGQWLADRLRR